MIFIPNHNYTGFINLNHIESLSECESNKGFLDAELRGGGSATVRGSILQETICRIIPAVGWECLQICDGAPEAEKLWVEPVFTLALNPFGRIAPVLPSALNETFFRGKYALRRRGEAQTYDSYYGGSYESAEAWLKAQQEGDAE